MALYVASSTQTAAMPSPVAAAPTGGVATYARPSECSCWWQCCTKPSGDEHSSVFRRAFPADDLAHPGPPLGYRVCEGQAKAWSLSGQLRSLWLVCLGFGDDRFAFLIRVQEKRSRSIRGQPCKPKAFDTENQSLNPAVGKTGN